MGSVADVVAFRPSKEERLILERARRALGLRTRSEALRYLVRKGAERAGPLSQDPVFRLRVPGLIKARRPLTSREIDETLYGGAP